MTARRPVAVIGGDLHEIPIGDSIASDIAGSGQPTPTLIPAATTYTLAPFTQTLFAIPIILGAGASISAGAGAYLVGVEQDDAAAVAPWTPTYIPAAATFTIPAHAQLLTVAPVRCDGLLVINGTLILVG